MGVESEQTDKWAAVYPLIDEFVEMCDRPPAQSELRPGNEEIVDTVRDRQWDAVIVEAGYDPDEIVYWNVPAPWELAEDIIQFAELLGRAPLLSEMEVGSWYQPETFVRVFDTWGEAITYAGVDSESLPERGVISSPYSRGNLKKFIRIYRKAEGDWPTVGAIDQFAPPSYYRYVDLFGTMENACRAAGASASMTLTPPDCVRQYTEDQLRAGIDEYVATRGAPPLGGEIEAVTGIPAAVYADMYGDVGTAVSAAGYEPREPVYRTATLLRFVRNCVGEYGRLPTSEELQYYTPVSEQSYWERFGSHDKTLQAAGFDPHGELREHRDDTVKPELHPNIYTATELIGWIHSYVAEFDEVPAVSTVDEWPGPAKSTYVDRFGSWRGAVRAAGYRPQSVRVGA